LINGLCARDNFIEVLGRLADLSVAQAAYEAAIAKHHKRICLCQTCRVIRTSRAKMPRRTSSNAGASMSANHIRPRERLWVRGENRSPEDTFRFKSDSD
jgi:hypothetical protein